MLHKVLPIFLERALKFIKTWDEPGYEALLQFEGRRLGFKLKGLPSFECRWDKDKLSIQPLGPSPDLLCSTQVSWLLVWFLYKAPIAKRHLQLQGDVMFAQALEEAVSHLNIEPADCIQHVVGDRFAEPVYQSLRFILSRVAHQPHALASSVSDYLCYEKGVIVSPAELTQYCEQVDILVNDTDRLEARIKLLRQSIC